MRTNRRQTMLRYGIFSFVLLLLLLVACGESHEQMLRQLTELDRMHGLDTYDYGARQHYPVLCRWDRMDPLCEKYYGVSPYVYCAGNPINAIDPLWEEYKATIFENKVRSDLDLLKRTYYASTQEGAGYGPSAIPFEKSGIFTLLNHIYALWKDSIHY